MPGRTSVSRVERAVALRKQQRSASEIAAITGVLRSTMARWLSRHGTGRLRQLTPREAVRRYERKVPGEPLRLDVKKLGRIEGIGHWITGDWRTRHRGAGWKFACVAVDDATRLTYVEILDDE